MLTVCSDTIVSSCYEDVVVESQRTNVGSWRWEIKQRDSDS